MFYPVTASILQLLFQKW